MSSPGSRIRGDLHGGSGNFDLPVESKLTVYPNPFSFNRSLRWSWLVEDFDYPTVGASNNPCSDIYAGSKPFSEVETQALRNYVLAHNNTIKVYLTLHSYGQK
ncbi:hypothetical protein KQX54_007114 [Cotesia glomerata]|uniref:Peptidase M14 domain-containing protein n=1 Tax=Cotesia glomerata TaxID=32391 RepID=A0AAV7IQC3_COTGL|nr:hypothetical protein KQX54_007114 [Cotesia glomerata]